MAGILPPQEIAYEMKHTQDDTTAAVVACIVPCFVISCTAVTLRIVARRLKHLSLEMDDYMAMLGMFFIAALIANIGLNIYSGMGKHVILSKHFIVFAKSYLAGEALYTTCIALIKLSLLFLYRRIFPTRRQNIITWIVGSFIVAWSIVGDCSAIFACVPMSHVWNPNVKAHCINFKAAVYAHSAQNIFTDLVLICLPMPLIWGLQMRTELKLQISSIFLLGAFATVASIARFVFIGRVSLLDPTWSDVQPTIWSMIELSASLTTCCLPTLGPILSCIRGRLDDRVRRRVDSDSSFGDRTGSGASAPVKAVKQAGGWRFGAKRARDVMLDSPRKQEPLPRYNNELAAVGIPATRQNSASNHWKPLPPSPPPYAWVRETRPRGMVESNAMRSPRRCSLCDGVELHPRGIRVTTELEQGGSWHGRY